MAHGIRLFSLRYICVVLTMSGKYIVYGLLSSDWIHYIPTPRYPKERGNCSELPSTDIYNGAELADPRPVSQLVIKGGVIAQKYQLSPVLLQGNLDLNSYHDFGSTGYI